MHKLLLSVRWQNMDNIGEKKKRIITFHILLFLGDIL